MHFMGILQHIRASRKRDKPAIYIISVLLALLITAVPAIASGQERSDGPTPEQQTSIYLESIRSSHGEIRAFFQAMPKGGDIHNHLAGAAYAEDIIDLAAARNLSIDPVSLNLSRSPCETGRTVPMSRAYEDPTLYCRLIDEWSVGGSHGPSSTVHSPYPAMPPGEEILLENCSPVLVDLRSRAAQENIHYLETMIRLPRQGKAACSLGRSLGFDDNLTRLYGQIMASGLGDIAQNASDEIEACQRGSSELLGCGSKASPGCDVEVRYQYCALRSLPLEEVFAQMVLAFEVAKKSPLVVGVNLDGPEHASISRRDYALHMKMLELLHGLYPEVRIDLHAGELLPGMVPPEDLRFHITEAIGQGNASRIGHGLDIMDETCPRKVLEKMEDHGIAVEIMPCSNEALLGFRVEDHPLTIYESMGVPVVLASDYPGVIRRGMTEQFVLVAEHHPGINYSQFKRFVRNSLEYSFLNGECIWARPGDYTMVVHDCYANTPGADELSPECLAFLEGSEKAQVQWRLEGDLARFEEGFNTDRRSAPGQAQQERARSITEIEVPGGSRHDLYKECGCCG